jgi:hypothetical protein
MYIIGMIYVWVCLHTNVYYIGKDCVPRMGWGIICTCGYTLALLSARFMNLESDLTSLSLNFLMSKKNLAMVHSKPQINICYYYIISVKGK